MKLPVSEKIHAFEQLFQELNAISLSYSCANEREKNQHILFKLFQPTGIIYGFPSNQLTKEEPKLSPLTTYSTFEQSLWAAAYLAKKERYQNSSAQDIFPRVLQDILHFYSSICDKMEGWILQTNMSIEEKTSMVIKKRILRECSGTVNPPMDAFLFLDTILLYGQLNQQGFEVKHMPTYITQLKTSILKVMSAAAHANHIIEHEEASIFTNFLHSAGLPIDEQRKIMFGFSNQVPMDALDSHLFDTWLLRKYAIELASLIIWSDRILEYSERYFLEKLAKNMALPEDELENSLIALESFVVNHWCTIDFLRRNYNYEIVVNDFIQRLSLLMLKYKTKIQEKINAHADIVIGIEKFNQEKLSELETKKLIKQLLQIIDEISSSIQPIIPSPYQTIPHLTRVFPKSIL